MTSFATLCQLNAANDYRLAREARENNHLRAFRFHSSWASFWSRQARCYMEIELIPDWSHHHDHPLHSGDSIS